MPISCAELFSLLFLYAINMFLILFRNPTVITDRKPDKIFSKSPQIILKYAQNYHIFDSYIPTIAHTLYKIVFKYSLCFMNVFLILLWNSMMITDRKMNGNHL